MLDLMLLMGFSYALYRLAQDHNITPWKWIIRFVIVFFVSSFALVGILIGIYGENMMKDMAFLAKVSIKLEPLVLLYQVVLFFFFRLRMLKYVHNLDQTRQDI
jgi:hypothetical protein